MTARYDGSSIDLEKQLVRYMVERNLTRRDLLELIAKVGAAAALAPVIAACSSASGSASPTTAASRSAAPVPTAAASASAGAVVETAAPTPPPKPEDTLNIYNWTEYLSDDAIPSFQEMIKATYGTDIKVNIDYFGNMDEAYAKLGTDGGGFDLSFPISVDIPALLAKRRDHRARQVAAPQHRQSRYGVVRSGVRPGQRPLDPVHVVDDRHRLRQGQDRREADQQHGRSGISASPSTSACSTTGRKSSG